MDYVQAAKRHWVQVIAVIVLITGAYLLGASAGYSPSVPTLRPIAPVVSPPLELTRTQVDQNQTEDAGGGDSGRRSGIGNGTEVCPALDALAGPAPVPCLKVLLGLFTTHEELGRRRGWRKLLQPQPHMNINGFLNVTLNPDDNSWVVPPIECGLNWVFVMGGSRAGNCQFPCLAEDDRYGSIVLPVVENMNEGKSYAWWRFAAQHFGGAHVIAKMDSDTRICPPKLYRMLSAALHNGSTAATYIGHLVDYINCGSNQHCPQGWFYASGGLHFLTIDLVRGLAELRFDLNEPQAIQGFEDLKTGQMLFKSKLRYKFHNTEHDQDDAYSFNDKTEAFVSFVNTTVCE